jgi:hypothetical protein
MDRMTAFTNLSLQLRSEGSDLEVVLSRLRSEGATIIECVKIVRSIESVPLGRAKAIVDTSCTWADRFAANDKLRTSAIEALERGDTS